MQVMSWNAGEVLFCRDLKNAPFFQQKQAWGIQKFLENGNSICLPAHAVYLPESAYDANFQRDGGGKGTYRAALEAAIIETKEL